MRGDPDTGKVCFALLRRAIALLLVLLLIPACAPAEDGDDWNEEDWEEDDRDEDEDLDDWSYYLKESELTGLCELQGDTLVILEGVTALGFGDEYAFTEQDDTADELKDGPQFDRFFDGADFRRVILPASLRVIGTEAFINHTFDAFTLPAQVSLIADGAFVYCSFDVLRIEADLPASVILDSLYDCSVKAYEVAEDHPTLRSVDGVLFSKDGKTLLSYPNGRTDAHYDVPAGVERIGGIHNEYLQTVSLPIGLRSVEDYAFSRCTRLHAVALPLTVREIGRDVFYRCVSLEMVSLPEHLEADKDVDGKWSEYYADDALFRGDNGDTLGGVRSAGRVFAPGRLNGGRPFSWGNRTYVDVYDTAEGPHGYRYYPSGKTVYMGTFRNGRVALYEPLGGTYAAADGYGSIIGWVNIADVAYLQPETLFEYASVKPRGTMKVWWNHLPSEAYWSPWETVIPMEGRSYKATLFGAFVRFEDPVTHAVFGAAIQDAVLTRRPDGSGRVLGIVYNTDFMSDIPLLAEPEGEELKQMVGGTQVEILEEKDGWVRVTDGRDTGWVGQDHVTVVPEQ